MGQADICEDCEVTGGGGGSGGGTSGGGTSGGMVIEFYEGNDCTQNMVKVDTARTGSGITSSDYTVSGSRWQNDEYRSMRILTEIRAGTTITVCDASDCSAGDDRTVYQFKQNTMGTECIRSFEAPRWWDPNYGWMTTYSDTNYFFNTNWYYVNGLDGKVSRVNVTG